MDIPEYWIVDDAGLGGMRYIGKPKQPTLSVRTLVDGDDEVRLFQGEAAIASRVFPELTLTATQVLRSGIG